MFPEGEASMILAGFAVGVVEKSAAISGQSIVAGDAVLGFDVLRSALERLFSGAQDSRPFAYWSRRSV